MRKQTSVRTAKRMSGFTLIELLVVIMIIGILLSITIFSQRTMQTYAEDGERRDDVTSIARRLEQAYINQDIGSPSYPTTNELLNDIANRTRTMRDTNADMFIAPGETSSSVVAAAAGVPDPLASMTVSQYVYQPLKRNGNLCQGNSSASSPANNCVRFRLFYKTAIGNSLQMIVSSHQQ